MLAAREPFRLDVFGQQAFDYARLAQPTRAMKRLVRVPLALLLVVLPIAVSATPTPKPNIIIILADDLGYGDTGCYGATKIPTPNVDRIGRQGLRFTDAHATSACCTPSRYSLLTG